MSDPRATGAPLTPSPDPSPDDAEGFASFGREVPASDVPALVRAGREVWTFGYGRDDDDEGFTTLQLEDLWAFDGPEADPAIVADWAPFRVEPPSAALIAGATALLGEAGYTVLSPDDLSWGECPDRDPGEPHEVSTE